MSSIFEHDEQDEVESSLIFKQAASDLTSVTNLEGTLSKFGYTKDDRIERRDMVVVFKTVEKDMEREISTRAHDGDYDGAKDMRMRLTSLRNEFENLQVNAVSLQRSDQKQLFDKAARVMKQQSSFQQKEIDYNLNIVKENVLTEMNIAQQIDAENLEKELERMPRPPIKYSRRLIELFKAEAGLIKLCEYEEARKVRTVIDRIRPREEKRFWAAIDAKMEAKRTLLAATQRRDKESLSEKLKSEGLKAARRKEMDSQLLERRLKNHSEDMHHAHCLQTFVKPEMSVKPSALWQKRPGYSETSAAMRGQHLLDLVHHKRTGASVHAETLVGTHDFEQPLKDTVDLSYYQRFA